MAYQGEVFVFEKINSPENKLSERNIFITDKRIETMKEFKKKDVVTLHQKCELNKKISLGIKIESKVII